MTKRDQRRREWTAHIVDYKASGLTMSAWCTARHITLNQLKYWLRKLKAAPSSTTPAASARFVPLSVEGAAPAIPASALVVRIGQASIELQADFDPVFLRKVVQALDVSC
ncbi:IS66 family insertion sequence element accessory protein TnpA [Paenibacillus elgii]|uniref:IS66 family insertion sequence element accessory protein TnpA n=1 Tax=Paenibacillus elgii TaxID=189691 RepID=UPI000248C27A|nr:hypothetical protein [Paenibacillus elgii]